MRITVTQLRATILVVNLVLAGSLVYKALDAYEVIDIVFGEGVTPEEHPASVDLQRFVYVPETFDDKDPALLVTRVATDLQPTKPEPPPIATTEPEKEKPGDETPAGPEELPEGPLAEDWEYVYYIAWHGDAGARNFAQLRKKKDDNTSRTSISRTRVSRSSNVRTRSNVRRPSSASSRYKGKKSETVSFLVSDREIRNDEFELHFWVHSADKEKLVYWMPGKPEKRYALPYQHEGSYLAQGPMRRELRPEEKEDEEEDEKEKKKFYLIHEDANPEEAREQRYAEIITGKTPESKFSPVRGKTSKAGSRSGDERSSDGPDSSAIRRPSQPTQEDMKELKSAIDKIPKEKQEQLQKELNGMLRGKKQ